MKRLILIAIAAMLAGQAWAEDFTIGKLKYTIIDAEEHTVSVSAASNKPTGALTIDSTVTNGNVTYRVTEIDSYGFQSCSGLTSVTLPKSLTTIKNNAFVNCSNLGSINIPASVTTLGGYIFYNCYALTSLTIPQSVTSIGGGLCSFCTKLTDIMVEAGNANYTSVDGVLYNGDTLLVMYPIGKKQTSFVLPNSVTQIGRSAFRGCTQLQSVTLNDGLTLVGGYAFNKCSNLKEINIPNTVSSIDDCAFNGCRSLKKLAIPESVTTIKEDAFIDCGTLVAYCEAEAKPQGWAGNWIPNGNTVVNGVVLNDDYVCRKNANNTVEVYSYIGSQSTIAIPESFEIHGIQYSTTKIGDNAFKNCADLTSITIPASVTEISPLAFAGCDATLNFDEDSDFQIEDGVLFNKDKTVLVGCREPLTGSYFIPNTVKSVGLFAGCADLAIVVIPASVTTVCGNAFANCDNLDIYCEAESKPEGWENNWNPADRHVTWGVISNGDYILRPTNGSEHTIEVARYIGSDASVTIPALFEIGGVEYSVTMIGDYAFNSCSNLTSITVPASVTEISPWAFAGCNVTLNVEGNTNYSAEDGVIFNNDQTVLIGCYKPLTSYSIPPTVKTIESFSCPSLTSIIIPSSVETIDSAAFADCSSLTSVTTTSDADYSNSCLYFISGGIKYKVLCIDSVEVVKHSYSGEVVIAASVTAGSEFNIVSIAPEAFKNCTGLTAIEIHINVNRVGADAFSGCDKLTSITINSPADLSNTGLCFTKNKFKYKVLTQDNVMFDSHNSAASGDFVIPETVTFGNTFTVIGIGYEALSGLTNKLTSVTIPNTVTFIEGRAFACCLGLQSITIPQSVTKIGSKAFYLCSGLSSVTTESDADYSETDLQFQKNDIYYTVLSKNTVEVANSNLYNDVVIPEKVNAGSEFTVVGIAASAFYNSDQLTSVTIPNTVKSIGASAFKYCKNLTSVTIPSSVTTIGQSAFYECSGLTSLTIPQGVTTIGSLAFNNCTGLKSVSIPESATDINNSAFQGCNNIETLTYNTDAIETHFRGNTKLKTVNIGGSVTSIAENAFNGCTSLTSINFPDGITSIGDRAFGNCSGLTSLTIPDGVTTIGVRAFGGCSGLKSVTIPESVTDIGVWAFDGCNSIETLTYNTNAIGSHYSIGSHFCSNASLKTVNIGNSVNSIVSGAFQHCTGLTSLTIPNSVENIGSYAFYNCTGLKSITISDSLKALESNAFENCSALTTIVIPKSTATVGGDVFKGCSNLTIYCEAESKPEDWADRWNPDNCPVIWGGNADAYTDDFKFEIIDEESLTAKITGYTGTNPNVIIPQKAKINGKDYSVTTIGSRVFDSNSILRSVFIPYTISNVESFAFGKNHYEAIICCEAAGDENTVPDGWASNWYGISVPAIAYNTHLDNGFVYRITDNSARNAQIIRYMGENDTVAVPEKINGGTYTVNSIAGYTFYECKAMKAIDIPSSVTEIGNYAFYGSSNIELLTYNTNAIGSNFQNSQSLKKVVIGNNVTKIDTWTFSHTGLEEVTFSASVKTVGSSAFSGCSKLKKADFASIESLCGIDFDIYESNPMEITHSLCVNGEEIVDAYIPNTVSSIGSHTFSGCSNLTSIAIPKSVTSIGEEAFIACNNLTIFCEAESQPEGWNEKWNPDNRPVVWGLYADKKLWQVTIESNNSEYGTVGGGGYVIDSTATIISATPAYGYHFAGWSDNNTDNPRELKVTCDTVLTALFEAHTVVIDTAVAATTTSTGLTEGSHCSVCGKVLVEQTIIPKLDNGGGSTPEPPVESDFTYNVISKYERLAEISGYIGSSKKVVIPSKTTIDGVEYTVAGIDGFAFDGCDTLTAVIIPNSVFSIGMCAFQGCSGLTSIVIPSSISDMGLDAFYDCINLTIYCEAASQPEEWNIYWNSSDRPVVWGSTGPGGTSEPPVESDFTYVITSNINRTVEITDYIGSKTDITIPAKATIDGVEYTVTGISAYSLNGCSSITSITIPNTVTNISNNAFANCTSLASISIPNSVTSIGGYAFYNCKKLASLTIPKSVTSIGNGLCSFCEELEAIVVESGNANYVAVDGVLYNSDMTRLVQYPVGKDAESFDFPETVTSTPRSSFRGCTNLKSVTFNDKLISIGGYAFDGCDNLSSVYIKKTVTTIGDNAFMGCSSLTIYCEADSQPSGWDSNWNSSDCPVVWGSSSVNQELKPEDFTYGIISFSNKTVEISSYKGTSTNIEIPQTVVLGGDEFSIVSIGYGAFKDCSILQSVTIPNTITLIEDEAFRNCSNLESVSLPNTIDNIGSCTFAECSSLKSVEIPNTVTFIGNGAFAESGLTSIVIPNSVTDISSYAFRDCANLASVEIPNSVKYIGISAFENCSSLTSVKIPSSVSDIGMAAFKGCSNATFECEAESKPDGWDAWWNYDNRPVAWSDNTSVSEFLANAVSIYAFDNTIVVENAADEIFVYDATGRLVCRDAIHRVSAKITVNKTGIYVVKVGNTVKRVIIND